MSPVVVLAAIASLTGCAASTSLSEITRTTEQASSTAGVSATLSATKTGSQTYVVSVTVTNNGNGPANNWQVALDMPNATIESTNGAEVLDIQGTKVFNPGVNGRVLSAGSSTSFNVSANFSDSYVAPRIVNVDGMTSGAGGLSPDGIDHIARTAASGALGVAFQYENNKISNNGDPNYDLYDGAIWAAQSYVISNGQIEFDPNMPGYAFIPDQAKAALATLQQDPSVASYLVSGLASCFADTSADLLYYFKTQTLKGFPTTKSGSLPGGPGSGRGAIDTFVVQSTPKAGGTEVIKITESTNNDHAFGMLTSQPFSILTGNTKAIAAKFTGGNTQMCTPFNGPGGGTANPYLVITLDGQAVAARQQQAGSDCQGACQNSVVQLDPLAYTIPGAQYDQNNNLLGPQINPYTLDPTDVYADPSHQGEFSLDPNSQYGVFAKPVSQYGCFFFKFLVCGMKGSGC